MSDAATAFDEDAWWNKLRALNPWAFNYDGKLRYPLSDWTAEHGYAADDGFRNARKAACWARYEQGVRVWNVWAEGMLALKAELEGRWDPLSTSDANVEHAWLHLQSRTGWDETKALIALSYSDLSGAELGRPNEYGHFVFPCSADFRSSLIRRHLNFSAAKFHGRTSFSEAIFEDDISFEGAEFSAQVDFRNARFNSTANFGCCSFGEGVTFAWAHFERGAFFQQALFKGECNLSGANFCASASFLKTKFDSRMRLDHCSISGPSDFRSSVFKEGVNFSQSEFMEEAKFSSAEFIEEADFSSTIFNDNAYFQGATFTVEASFKCSKFEKPTDFRVKSFGKRTDFTDTTFKADVDFSQTQLTGYTTFHKTQFKGPAKFVAVSSADGAAVSFADAQFDHVPDFEQANFKQAPRLDNVRVEPVKRPRIFAKWTHAPKHYLRKLICTSTEDAAPPFWRTPGAFFWSLFPKKSHADLAARYRSLKRLAIQAHDSERELDFNARELKAQRWSHCFPTPGFWGIIDPIKLGEKPKSWWHRNIVPRFFYFSASNCALYWAGVLYQCASNFGRSMLLPLVWLGVFLVATMCLHLTEHRDRATNAFARCGYPASASACIGEPGVTPDRCVTGDGAPLGEAFYLALTQTLVIGSVATTDATRQAYGCLYGSATPTIPDWIRIWSVIQSLLSVTLITLFIQALRNHFRIR